MKIISTDVRMAFPLLFFAQTTMDGGSVITCEIRSTSLTILDIVSNPDDSSTNFGYDFDLDSSFCIQWLYIGSPEFDSGNGTVYIYEFDGNSFTLHGQVDILPSNGTEKGQSVSVTSIGGNSVITVLDGLARRIGYFQS